MKRNQDELNKKASRLMTVAVEELCRLADEYEVNRDEFINQIAQAFAMQSAIFPHDKIKVKKLPGGDQNVH